MRGTERAHAVHDRARSRAGRRLRDRSGGAEARWKRAARLRRLQLDMLRQVRARLGTDATLLVCASGSELPFRDRIFDLTFLVGVLGEIPDKERALREYRRTLRPGGTLAVTEGFPDPDYVRSSVLRRMAVRCGFEVCERFSPFPSYTQRLRRPATGSV